jgi:anti-anti-sigma regulatory factor
MLFKIETKEKFNEISIKEPKLAANMAGELQALLNPFIQTAIKNVILILTEVQEIALPAAEAIADIQQAFYDVNASFVICDIHPTVENYLDEIELLETMNVTPTLSEAWDIVQMEEIEREYFGDEDEQEK